MLTQQPKHMLCEKHDLQTSHDAFDLDVCDRSYLKSLVVVVDEEEEDRRVRPAAYRPVVQVLSRVVFSHLSFQGVQRCVEIHNSQKKKKTY